MRFKILLRIAATLTAILFIVSCDDDIDSIGKSLQPDSDDITLKIDHVQIEAETYPLNKKVYIESDKALLGEINDPVFGKLKADFLAEFFCATNTKFELGHDNKAVVDSVQLHMGFLNGDFTGDTISPMGVSVYEITKELEPNFFTNIKPIDFCDMKTILGQRFFSAQDLPRVEGGQFLTVELNKEYGANLLEEWQNDNKVLSNSKELKKILKGIYVTSDFNDKAIIELYNANVTTRVMVYYSYQVKKVNKPKEDSTVIRSLPLPIAAEALKLNSVWNTPWEDIKDWSHNGNSNSDNKKRTLIKAPAGIVTKLTIPIKEIKKKAKDRIDSDKFIINSASFKLTGLTEEEDKLDIKKRPNALLFINKDSIDNFFLKGKMPDARTSLTLHRASDNTYNFAFNNSAASASNNLASLINYYLKENPEIEELEYLLIPISATINSETGQITNVANSFTPSAAILRTKDEFMKMSLIFSKHSQIVK